MPRRFVRWRDVLCQWHQTAARCGAPRLSHERIAADCRDCAVRMTDTIPHGGTLQPLSHLPPATRRYLAAVHEAGHAIIGTAAGRALVSLELVDLDHGNIAGRCEWSEGSHIRDVSDHVSMVLAGHYAAVHWSRAHGLDDDDTLTDLAMESRFDYAELRNLDLDASLARLRMGPLLDAYWGDITTTANTLAARGRLTGADITPA